MSKGFLHAGPPDCKYGTLPTVDDFLETIEHENGAIEIREKKNVENTLEKFVETKKNFEKEQSDPLVEIQNLTVRFRSSKGFLRKKTEDVLAVDGIDLTIQKGKTLDGWANRVVVKLLQDEPFCT